LSFFTELKRRNVTRVGIAYLVLSWLMAQVAEMLLDTFGAPAWAFKTLLALFVIGFPFALFFAWAFELTPDGLKREKDIDHDQPMAKNSGRKLDFVIIALLVIALGYFIYQGRDQAPPPAEPGPAISLEEPAENVSEPVAEDASIAVIPFLNLSSDKEQEYFSDGLADTILHMLAQIPELRVAARTSSFKFKGKNEDVREIAAMLGVAMVLEGSVQRQGEKVRITVQLIQGADGSHIWSRVYDDTLDDIFRVQDEIATGVTEAMLGTSALADSSPDAETGVDIKSLGGTKNVAAYDAFLKGQTALDEGTPEGVNKALVLLQLAVELDPEFARAWVELARASFANASIGNETWQTAQKKSLDAAERALALEPRMASTHVVYAQALTLSGLDTEKVRASILKANELEPNNALALAALASLRATQGKHREALLLTEKAILINPLDTDLNVELAFRRMGVGLVEESLSGISRIAAMQPNDLAVQRDLSTLHRMAGNRFEAIKLNQQLLENNPNVLRPLFTATFSHMSLNDVEAADEYLKRIELLSPKRAFDDRYYFCLRTGDRACAKESGAR
jgi:TolB-like protein/tetratricopeptide (TPR) repeat protein